MYRYLPALMVTVWPALAATSAAEVSRQILDTGLDPTECYRVIEQNFTKEDVTVYFSSGYLIFARAVNGYRPGAVFTSDVEGGDAELVLIPPVRSERFSLAHFTEAPNLDEHFRSAILLSTDGTADQLLATLKSGGARRSPEMGALLADKWSPSLKNFLASFEVRMVGEAFAPQPHPGFFFMTVSGVKLGNFDLIVDSLLPENVMLGQISERQGRSLYDVWTSFAGRSRRNAPPPGSDVAVDNYRIDATLEPNLALRAVTRVTVTPKRAVGRALAFSISQQMRVLQAKVDGQVAEVFEKESVRANLISAGDNQEFLVVAPVALEPGKEHEFEFRHEGAVVSEAGDQVYYVGARGNWYPRRGLEFARYDLTFRSPNELGFLATGEIVDDRVEGNVRITRRVTNAPIRVAGFNLGNYKSVSIAADPYRVEVYANRRIEKALVPQEVAGPTGPATPIPAWQQRRRGAGSPLTMPTTQAPRPPPNPAGRLEALARDLAAAFSYMASQFGPPPIKTLTVSPIPGGFGQGFPGLLYLSTLAYLDPSQRPEAATRDRFQRTFFSEMLEAHEVAHQWWGNLVVTAGYQDAWLMEALANYSAILYLEKKKGTRALEMVLEDYKAHLLEKGPAGHALESAGPITWGYRLKSSLAPDAWNHITYEKGAWILHMLRRRLGDERFSALLRELCTRYQYRPLTTEQFRSEAQRFVPPHSQDADLTGFFDSWVYGTGIPAVKLNYSVRGLKVTGAVSQSGVADDFSARIPIEIQAGRQRIVQWVNTAADPAPFTIALKAPPTRVSVAVKDALITLKK